MVKTLQRAAAPLGRRAVRENLLAIVAADRAFPAAVAELGLWRSTTMNAILALAAVVAIGLQGCAAPPTRQPQSSSEEFLLGSLTIDLPSFRTLDELREWGKPHDASEAFHLFPAREPKLAVVVPTWGSGDSWNAVFIYVYDEFRHQWYPRALWNTEAKSVRVSFDEKLGVIEVRSGHGHPIFSANISALRPRSTRDW